MGAGVRVETEGTVCTIVLSRPEARNAVDEATARELREAFMEFEHDTSRHVAVLWGEGGHFCAGADLKELARSGLPPELRETGGEGPGPMGPTRMALAKPVIAAVSGHAVAGGLELALWCDLRVVEEDATFGVFCRRFGVPLIDGGTVRLPRLIGLGRALDLILTGRPVGAQEAHFIGLADRVVPAGQARTSAEALAREIAAHPQECLRADRASALAQFGLSLHAALRAEGDGARHVLTSETLEGAARFAGGEGRHGKPPGKP